MTLAEFAAECTRARMVREQCGLDPDTARLVMVVPGRLGKKAPGARRRVLPGLYGKSIGDVDEKRILVDVMVVDAEAWLTRRTRTPSPRAQLGALGPPRVRGS